MDFGVCQGRYVSGDNRKPPLQNILLHVLESISFYVNSNNISVQFPYKLSIIVWPFIYSIMFFTYNYHNYHGMKTVFHLILCFQIYHNHFYFGRKYWINIMNQVYIIGFFYFLTISVSTKMFWDSLISLLSISLSKFRKPRL